MAYWDNLRIRGDTSDLINEICEKDNIGKDNLIKLSLLVYQKSKEIDLKSIDKINEMIRTELNVSLNFMMKKKQSLQAERLMLVKNVYAFVWQTLNQNFDKPEVPLLLENINLSILRCRINGWEYQEKQLLGLHQLIDDKQKLQSHEIISSIRNYMDR